MIDKSEKKHNKKSIVAGICSGLLALTSLLFIYNFFELRIVPNSTCFLILLLILFINIEAIVLSAKEKTTIVAIILAVVLSLIMGTAGYYMRVSSDALEKITGISTSVDVLGVYVESSSEITELQELAGVRIGILDTLGRETTDQGVEILDKEIKHKQRYIEYKDVGSLTEALINNRIDAIFINTSYLRILEDSKGLTNGSIKCIHELEVTRALDFGDEDASNIDITQDPFVVYISGNDNDGTLKANGRSDVNILMVVDPDDRKILLVNTPRDYYVKLAGINENDKLTHAGMYGIDTSVRTLEDLYGISIPYYIRLNFTGFIDLIDALGGITVYSDVDFTVAEWHFVEGANELSGIEALAFARERYSFVDGDRQRGRNQQAVIKGIINKLSSPKVITNYSKIMDATADALETNMSQQEITSLLNYQLTDRRSWDVSSISVDGKGKHGECYSFPSEELYLMIPDLATVENAKKEIDHIIKKKGEL